MAQLTFLQLTQRLARECGVAGTGPLTVVGQTGEAGRLVNWINAAWLDVQEQHDDWNWLRTSVTFATVASQATYTPTDAGVATTLGHWKKDSFRIYTTSDGYPSEVFLGDIGYDDWRNLYQFGSLRTVTTRPIFVAVAPNRSLCLGPTPDALGYTVVGDYFLAPTQMSADADIPTLPERFQLAIVYRAMMMYAMFESAPEVLQQGQTEFNRIMRRLEVDQQPQMLIGNPLV